MCRDKVLTDRVKVDKTAMYQVAERGDHQRMLSFIDKEENVLSASYLDLKYSCANGDYLYLNFNNFSIAIRGSRLGKISRALADYRLIYLREAPSEPKSRGPRIDYMSFDFDFLPMKLEELINHSKRSEIGEGHKAA